MQPCCAGGQRRSEGARVSLPGGFVSEGTAVGPSLETELFPPLQPNGVAQHSSDLEAYNRELLVVAALEVRLAGSCTGFRTRDLEDALPHLVRVQQGAAGGGSVLSVSCTGPDCDRDRLQPGDSCAAAGQRMSAAFCSSPLRLAGCA